jgi:hypothetical protein
MDIFYISSILNILWYLFSALFVLYKFTSFFSYLYNFIKFCGKLINGLFYIKNQTLSYFNYPRHSVYNNYDIESGQIEPDIGVLNTNTYTRPSLFTRVKNTLQNLYDSSVAYGRPIYETIYDDSHGIYNSSFDTDAIELNKFIGQKSEEDLEKQHLEKQHLEKQHLEKQHLEKQHLENDIKSENTEDIGDTEHMHDIDKKNFYKSLKKITNVNRGVNGYHELESISEMESVNFETTNKYEPIKFNKSNFKSKGNWLNKEGLSDNDLHSIIDEDDLLFENP